MSAELREQVTVILSLAAALDPRFATNDLDQARARVVAWTDALEDVDGRFALDFVRRYYRTHHDWPVTPGAIRTAWLRERDRREARARQPLALTGVCTSERSPEVLEEVARCREVIAENKQRRGVI